MLRRPATTIKLTPEDILEYDDTLMDQQNVQLQYHQKQHQHDDFILQEQINTNNNNNNSNINNNIHQDMTAKDQSKDERIGIVRNN